MKRIATLILTLFVVLVTYAQHYKQLISEGTHTVEDIKHEAKQYFDSVGRERGTGYTPYRRWLYFAERSMDETGRLKSPEFYYNELIDYNSRINNEGFANRTTVGAWEDMGPTYWNATSGYNPGVGRITSIAIEEGNLNHIIVGSETGGVWKSLDGGVSWQVLTDNLANIDVYALAIDPINNTHYYWGSTGGTIFKSTDAGATWSLHSDVGNGVVNKILIDPTDTSKIYASAQGGGLFKSIDGGLSWARIHSSASTGYDIEFKPGDPSVVYASGTVFYKSSDGGATFSSGGEIASWSQEFVSGSLSWTITGANQNSSVTPKTGSGLGLFYINNFTSPSTRLVSPALDLSGATNPILKFSYSQVEWLGDQDELKVLYRTSASSNWEEIAHYTTDVTAWNDITLNLPNPTSDYYIAFEGQANYGRGITLDDISIEADNLGVVFSEGFEGASNEFSNGVKMIGVSADDPSIVYVLEADGGVFGGFHKSTDEGSSFVKLNHDNKNYFGYDTLGQDNLGQAPRDMDIVVHPEDANDVHIAGINSWRSIDGGATFSITSQWTPGNAASLNIGYCHADVDIMLFAQEGSSTNPITKLFLGTDGGIFRADNPRLVSSNYYTDITTGMGIRQFYKIGISQTNPVIVTGGSQDNGSSTLGANGLWTDWWGADGMEGFIDKNDTQIMYGTSQFGSFVKTFNGGLSINGVAQPDGKGGNFNWNWIVPYGQDPLVNNRIYSAFDEVYQSNNGGNSWTSISQNFGSNIDHFKVAPSDNTVKYLAINGSFYISIGNNTNWTAASLNLNGGRINEIAIHPTNPAKVAIATTDSGKVYVSNNNGVTWNSIAWDLPNFVPQALAWQDNGEDGLYVGMNYGVYYTDNSLGNTWIPFNNGLPNVRINELEINTAENKLYAATYGRGLWRTDLYDEALSISDFNIDNLSVYPNPAKDFINLKWNRSEGVNVRLYNVLGDLVYYAKNKDLSKTLRMDTSAFAEGLYFVKLNTSIGEITKKVIIE
ncbi:T9SS type A sorting domain-containing protein [Winogradskyella sp. DF17]|uniref:T9SS type A sorting domain-containing protein n=1 Tax=Winogradskyella pelagia TaxID=2819984 RepID=A0ABS3T1Z0_9FLAO|nr:T9SS type A sorting domain-containing protein [Winogradskyella sp. DF17]MBO3116766.1 T9SS type A sorting domain-containing protein [Winogradskyella sp. DF17]